MGLPFNPPIEMYGRGGEGGGGAFCGEEREGPEMGTFNELLRSTAGVSAPPLNSRIGINSLVI